MATSTRRRQAGTRRTAESDAPRPSESRRGAEGRPGTGAKRTVVSYIKQLPQYLRLLGGLLTDRRVQMIDKLLVAAAAAYILMPVDIVPDFIPFFGEVDDLYLLVLALQRLIGNAGRRVLLDHWAGDPADLADLNLRQALAAAAFFLPRRIRRKLRVIGRA
jgi:uncharacterized membrane protein YkvA (DUF1232 family)